MKTQRSSWETSDESSQSKAKIKLYFRNSLRRYELWSFFTSYPLPVFLKAIATSPSSFWETNSSALQLIPLNANDAIWSRVSKVANIIIFVWLWCRIEKKLYDEWSVWRMAIKRALQASQRQSRPGDIIVQSGLTKTWIGRRRRRWQTWGYRTWVHTRMHKQALTVVTSMGGFTKRLR